jgi:ABC-2 type transport system permease protein
LLIILGYTLYFCIWVMVSVLISAAMRRARDALLVLVGCWMIATVLLPRILPAIAADKIILPTGLKRKPQFTQHLQRLVTATIRMILTSQNSGNGRWRNTVSKKLKTFL